jgi:hypothetical protein
MLRRVHSINAKSLSNLLFERLLKWYLQESNQGHTDFQSVALPTELRYHHLVKLDWGANLIEIFILQKEILKKLK